jgi:hypothetical protein
MKYAMCFNVKIDGTSTVLQLLDKWWVKLKVKYTNFMIWNREWRVDLDYE